MKEYLKYHTYLIVFDKNQFVSKSQRDLADKATLGLLSAHYDQVLEHPSLQPIFKIRLGDVNGGSYTLLLGESLKEVRSNFDDELELESYLIFAAAACLHLFIQANFTGPALELDPYLKTVDRNGAEDDNDIKKFNEHCIDLLASDGEPAYALTSYPHLLLIASSILKDLTASLHSLKSISQWWYVRALLTHQSILDSASSSLHESIFQHFSSNLLEHLITELPEDTSTDYYSISTSLKARFYLELARAQLQYDYDAKAEHSIKLAQSATQLQYILTGYKAKRTKYQQTETSQMVFIAKSKVDKDFADESHDDSFDSLPPPISLELNSDLLLEKVNYSKATAKDSSLDHSGDYGSIPEALRAIDPNSQPALQDIDTSIILLRQSYIKSSSPYNNPLVQEELLAIANRIINSPESSVNWCLYSRALWERSLLEAASPKTVERGTLQMQSLVDELGQSTVGTFIPKQKKGSTSSGNIAERLSYVHQVLPLPKWSMDAKLAERFMSIGVLKSALEVYERLAMWDQVALCYAAVGQEEKGQEVLEEHLKKYPRDARSWSILGEITENPEYFGKAWEVGRYPSARRSLGRFYYNPPKDSGVERDIELAIKYLNEALSVNPLNHPTWFLYGCAGLETEQYDLAAEAFTRCVAIDELDGKSWSNLSTSLLRLGKKEEAFSALKRAVRVTSEKKNWRIWSNYVTVAVDLGNWNEVLNGTKELLTIESEKGEQSLDVNVLERLSQILVSTKYPAQDSSAEESSSAPLKLDFFQKSALELFVVTLPNLITSNARLWKIVARVELWRNRPWAALESYEKGFRIYTHLPEVESDEKVWDEAVESCSDLVDAYINLGPREGKFGDGSLVCSNWKFKARSSIRILIGRGKKWWEDSNGWNKLQELKEEIV